MDLLAGKKLQRRKEKDLVEVDSADALKGVEILGLFFAAHWCGSCRDFTKKLLEFYKERKAKNDGFEIVFLSWDNTVSEMNEFVGGLHGDWLLVPFDQEVLRQQFVGKYGVECIPELIIFKGAQLITKEGRWDIELKKGQCYDAWKTGKRATTEAEVSKFVEEEEA